MELSIASETDTETESSTHENNDDNVASCENSNRVNTQTSNNAAHKCFSNKRNTCVGLTVGMTLLVMNIVAHLFIFTTIQYALSFQDGGNVDSFILVMVFCSLVTIAIEIFNIIVCAIVWKISKTFYAV